MGGDWNTVWDRSENNTNIDTFNMHLVPNKVNCELLRNMCIGLSLLDPTRVLYPNSRLYTYAPFGNLRSNRSRLDFFVISDSLLPALLECKPALVPTINLFDHKPVTLRLGQAEVHGPRPPAKLRNSNLGNSYLRFSVLLAAYNCYMYGILVEGEDDRNASQAVDLIRQKGKVISEKLKELMNLKETMAIGGINEFKKLQEAGMVGEIEMHFSDLPSIDALEQFRKKADSSTFFESLVKQTSIYGIKAQKKIAYLYRLNKTRLIERITELSVDFTLQLEVELRTVSDKEIQDRLQDLKIFEILNAEKSNLHFFDLHS